MIFLLLSNVIKQIRLSRPAWSFPKIDNAALSDTVGKSCQNGLQIQLDFD